jgi:superfamily II DNA or RNA helicase/CBS domain-containing protein
MSGDDDELPMGERFHEPSRFADLHPLQAQVMATVENFLASGNADRALIQLAAGVGKLHLIANICARLLDSGRYHKILIITDTRFQAEQIAEIIRRQSRSIQNMSSGAEPLVELLEPGYAGTASILIATIQRVMHSSRGVEQGERSARSEFMSQAAGRGVFATCDVVLVEETQPMMYLTRQSALEGLSVPLIGFTSNADSKTLEFFGGRLLWKYTPEQAIEAGYILGYDVFRLNLGTHPSGERGAGSARDVIDAPDEVRSFLHEFKALLFSAMFPGRTIVPKTLIFAKSHSHADLIVDLCREVFEANPAFAVKITSQTEDPQAALARFRYTEAPRIVVTVSFLTSGVDIPPLECLVFMRDVRSEALFQQMLDRGSQRIDSASLQAVTPDASEKTRFVVVDGVGVTDEGHFAQDSHIPRRRQHLLDGRRVRVADLLAGGFLAAGAYLRYKPRQRAGPIATATVAEGGTILFLDGREFRSPSAAASAVAGYPVDGWHAWVTEEEDATLDELRQALLAAALDDLGQEASETTAFLRELDGSPGAEGNGSGLVAHEETDRKIRRLAELKDIRRRAEESEPRTMTVRDLIALWGARGRDSGVISAIEADLANYGLLTEPDFRTVTLEDEVALKLAAKSDALTATEAPRQDVPALESSKASARTGLHERGLTIGNLPSANRTVESVPPNASFEQVITKMLVFDYSQLAVMSGERSLRGAVTWRSIAKVRHRNPDAQLSSAIIRAAEVSYKEDLVDVLPRLAEDEFVFVRGPKGNISGIVTASDVLQSYAEMTSPFFIIGEIDQTLRWILETYVDLGVIQSLCDPDGRRRMENFSKLTMGDYQRVLENSEAWGQLDWPLDRRVFSERLREIREIRNNIMHFNGDPLPDDVLGMLKNFLSLLREYSDS